METHDLVRVMKERAAAAGTVIRDIRSMDEAVRYTVDLCREKKMRTVTGIDLEAQDLQRLSDLCAKESIEMLLPPLRAHADAIDFSLTPADAGIADTGTLMLRSDSEDIRIATMLAKIHVAVLSETRIKKDSAEIEQDLDALLKSDSPSYTAFITGPSRTADIERVLAIGVHGPLELHLLVLKEDKA